MGFYTDAHAMMDRALAAFIAQSEPVALPSQTSVMEFLTWLNEQRLKEAEPSLPSADDGRRR